MMPEMPLDEQRTMKPAATWSADQVRARLVEAFAIERRMPGQGLRRLASAWPAAPLHEFRDLVGWDDARERVLDTWSKSKGVYSWEVTRMEEAIEWFRWLPEGERRCLMAWAAAKVRGIPIRKVLRKHGGWTHATFYRRRDQGSERIANRLNERGVAVR